MYYYYLSYMQQWTGSTGAVAYKGTLLNYDSASVCPPRIAYCNIHRLTVQCLRIFAEAVLSSLEVTAR